MGFKFRIYYGLLDPETQKPKTWTFEGAGLEDAIRAPRGNIQVIVNEEPWREANGKRGRGLQHGKDYYVWRDEMGWFGLDLPGREYYLDTYPGACVCLKGWSQRDEAYHECVRRATREGLGNGDPRANQKD